MALLSAHFLLIGFTLLTAYFSYLATLDISTSLSPQGCQMSYMSPSYVLQTGFDKRWSNLAGRYSLYLYREVAWDDGKLPSGIPVLFIPGNAGAAGQVRSIASSATRQYFQRPGVVADEFETGWKRGVKPLDFFALDFNEDLSAFHGPTLESQLRYASNAISYILSLYPAKTQIIVMGHSMGGVVADSLLPSPNISAIITMSTPHTLPPARFDARIDKIYSRNQQLLATDTTPIVSLCGGATDMMIPSEACILPPTDDDVKPFRRTVFTSALEGAWTGVGHREMVWCHQVRWRVARAALELGAMLETAGRSKILDNWLRDGHTLPPTTQPVPGSLELADGDAYEVLPQASDLMLKDPHGDARTYLLPYPRHVEKVVLYVSSGSVNGIAPYHRSPLRVSPYTCHRRVAGSSSVICSPLKPTMLKLVPNPLPGKPFPVPQRGADESEGVVLFEADIAADKRHNEDQWIGFQIDGADGHGWVVAGFAQSKVVYNIWPGAAALWRHRVELPREVQLRTQIDFPNLVSNVLAVYKLTAKFKPQDKNPSCSDTLLPPVVMHTSHSAETHYFPLVPITEPAQRILLHTHATAPYVPQTPGGTVGTNIVIYSSGSAGCLSDLEALFIELDWSATVGRWASRYPTTLVCWAVGIVALILFRSWGVHDKGAPMPSVSQSLSDFVRRALPRLLWMSFVLSFLPFPVSIYLGNRGQLWFSFLAPLILCLATGVVCISWMILAVLIWPISRLKSWAPRDRGDVRSAHRSTAVSLTLICGLIFLFVPWQVAYLGCWVFHLFTCASEIPVQHTRSTTTIPLLVREGSDGETGLEASNDQPIDRHDDTSSSRHDLDNHHHHLHLLLFMTWLLPLTAPTLAVWVRTLITAGPTTPFDGDHNFLRVVPFLVLADFVSRCSDPLFQRQSFERRWSVRWLWVGVALVAMLLGARRVYLVFDVATISAGVVVMVRIGRRYWGGPSWTP
ncbi:GPI inositol deacylase [Pleurotus ostreatus]|nr:GPI inositol deacylase [Pleurotus ostreatus]